MSEESIFTEVATPAPVIALIPTAPVLPDEVAALVGEGKKYKTAEDALKAIPHAQGHIAKLEQELKELRESQIQARSIDELYEVLASRQAPAEATPPAQGYDDKTLDAVLERKLEEKRVRDMQLGNLSIVDKALKDKFGDKAKEAFDAKAKELGVSTQFLQDVAARSSQAALELFGAIQKPAPISSTPAGTINTQSLAPKTNVPRTVMAGATSQELLAGWRAAAPN
jgi:hypothetical protein